METGKMAVLRLDVPYLKSDHADEEGGGADGEEGDLGLEELGPWRGLLEDQKPAFEMIGYEPFLVILKERDVLHDHVHEKIGKREDGGGGGFHVEARKHECHR